MAQEFEQFGGICVEQLGELGGDEGEELVRERRRDDASTQRFPGVEGELALGDQRSDGLHEAADVVEGEGAAAIDLGDLEIVLQAGDGGGEGVPGVDGEFELAGAAPGGNEDGVGGDGVDCFGVGDDGGLGWGGADRDVGLDEGVELLPFVGLPLGIGEDEAVGSGGGSDPKCEEFDGVGFGEDDGLVGGKLGEGLVIGLGDGLEQRLRCAGNPLWMVLEIIPRSHGRGK